MATQYDKPLLRELNHLVVLCTMHDVVNENGRMILTREAKATVRASIKPLPAVPYLSTEGYVIMGGAAPTYAITIRKRAMVGITSAAWVYEERRKSPPRWWKVTGVSEHPSNEWMILSCILTEESEAAPPPVDGLAAAPNNVRL